MTEQEIEAVAVFMGHITPRLIWVGVRVEFTLDKYLQLRFKLRRSTEEITEHGDKSAEYYVGRSVWVYDLLEYRGGLAAYATETAQELMGEVLPPSEFEAWKSFLHQLRIQG